MKDMHGLQCYTTPYHTMPHHTTPHHTGCVGLRWKTCTAYSASTDSDTPHHTTPYHTMPHHTTPHHTGCVGLRWKTCTAYSASTDSDTPHHTTPYHTMPHHTTPHHTGCVGLRRKKCTAYSASTDSEGSECSLFILCLKQEIFLSPFNFQNKIHPFSVQSWQEWIFYLKNVTTDIRRLRG